MKKTQKNKVAVIGLGSIGQRHFRNLSLLGYRDIGVYDTDQYKLKNVDREILPELNEKTLKPFKAVFICNPNDKHVATAILAVKASCDIFIEKPLSNTLIGTDVLADEAKSKKLVTMVGCNMRFHPSVVFIKKFIETKKLGKIYSISHEFGYYLPLWRPGTDYSKNYAAKRKSGGGIILDDIHEFDLLFWLNGFRAVKKKSLIFNKISDLQIETEDQVVGTFLFDNGVIGSVRANYLSRSYRRNVVIIGERGTLTWDFKDNIVWLETEEDRKEIFSVKDFDTNDMYLSEVKHFMSSVVSRKDTGNSVARARQLLSNVI